MAAPWQTIRAGVRKQLVAGELARVRRESLGPEQVVTAPGAFGGSVVMQRGEAPAA